MQINLRTLVLASAVMATAALTSIPAVAAHAGATILHVPFAFSVAGKTLAAGDYMVKCDSNNIISLQSADASQHFSWVTNITPENGGRVVLRFGNNGQIHVLEAVQFGALVTAPLARHSGKTEDISPSYAVDR